MGAPAVAEAERRSSDWVNGQILESQQVGVLALPDSTQRQHVADGWLRVGLRLHRGVVDGSRLTLELMAVGAPAELLDRAEACCSELTDVAAIAFAVASAYAGTALAPGGLSASEPLRVDPAALVLGLFHEGFFGGEIALRVHGAWREADLRPEIAQALQPIFIAARNSTELARGAVEWLLSGAGATAIAELERARPQQLSFEGLPLLSPGASDPHLQRRGLLAPEWLATLGERCLHHELPQLRSRLLRRVTH